MGQSAESSQIGAVPRGPRLINRAEAARILWGCSEGTIRNLEREGLLTALRLPIGKAGRIRIRFDPEKVHALKPSLAHLRDRVERRGKAKKWDPEEGDRAARVFELLRAGKSKVEIVIEARVAPSLVVELREQFQKTFADHDREAKRERRRREDQIAQRERDKEAARREREERAAADERKRRKEQTALTVTVEACPRRLLHPGIAAGSRCKTCGCEGKA